MVRILTDDLGMLPGLMVYSQDRTCRRGHRCGFLIISTERQADLIFFQGSSQRRKGEKLQCTEQPDQEIIKSYLESTPMLKTGPTVAHVIIITVGHSIT